jgi:hypothetical protein
MLLTRRILLLALLVVSASSCAQYKPMSPGSVGPEPRYHTGTYRILTTDQETIMATEWTIEDSTVVILDVAKIEDKPKPDLPFHIAFSRIKSMEKLERNATPVVVVFGIIVVIAIAWSQVRLPVY